MPNASVLEYYIENHNKDMGCNVMKIPFELRCEFVKNTRSCKNFEGFINYLKFVECGPMSSTRPKEIFSCLALGLLIVYYLLCMAIVADQFYSPALKATASKLHMSEHLAGVTLLAFGNSTSDLIAYMKTSGMSTLFTYMVSNAIFITLISGGLVCLLWPAHLLQYKNLPLMLFFILSVQFTEYGLTVNVSDFDTSIVTIREAVGVIILYSIYLTITIVEGFLKSTEESAVIILEQKPIFTSSTAPAATKLFSRSTKPYSQSAKFSASGANTSVDIEATRNADFRAGNSKNEYIFDGFLESIQPINEDSWRQGSFLIRVGLIILSPLTLFFLLLIPTVDLAKSRHGWSKLLNCTQIVVTPLYTTIILLYRLKIEVVYQLLITVPLAIIIFRTSRTDLPPKYHFLFVFLSAAGSIIMLYVLIAEMNEILQVIAMIFGLSNSFVAATISCWGSSLCTVVINAILASHGYASMAFTASYAGPFFNFMIAMGVLPLYKAFTKEATLFLDTDLTELAYVFLMISLCSAIFWLLLFNFVNRRSVGVFNITIYSIYILYCVLCELKIIHSYSEDPIFDVK